MAESDFAPTLERHHRWVDGSETWKNWDVFIINPQTGKMYDATESVISIEYRSSFETAYCEFSIEFRKDSEAIELLTPPNWILVKGFIYGKAVFNFRNTNKSNGIYDEIDRAQITTVEATAGLEGNLVVSAKDPAWILVKDKIPYRMPKGTLTERLRFLEGRGLIKLARDMIATTHVIEPTRGGQVSVWEDIVSDLTETNFVEGKHYVLRHSKGQFDIVDLSRITNAWSFEVGQNLFSLKVSKSIEDFYNAVYVISSGASTLNDVIGDADEPNGTEIVVAASAIDDDSAVLFGKHYLIESETKTLRTPDAQKQAEYLLRKHNRIKQNGSLQSYSLSGLKWGDRIFVYEPQTRVVGQYFVRSVAHQVVNGMASMSVEIDFEKVVPDTIRVQEESFMDEFLGDE